MHEVLADASIESAPESRLVELVRAGDRAAGAEFLRRHRDVLRQRIRRRLRHVSRRLFDSQEILSTVCRRLDRMVLLGTVRAVSPAALMGLVVEIADHSVVDKARVFNRIDDAEGADSVFAKQLRRRMEAGEADATRGAEEAVALVFEGLAQPRDREILGLWLRGCPLRSIAEELDTQPAAMRKQWQKIRERCLSILGESGAA